MLNVPAIHTSKSGTFYEFREKKVFEGREPSSKALDIRQVVSVLVHVGLLASLHHLAQFEQ